MRFRNLHLILVIQFVLGLGAANAMTPLQGGPGGERCHGSSNALPIALRYKQQIRREIQVPPHQLNPEQDLSPCLDGPPVRLVERYPAPLSLAKLSTDCTRLLV